MLHFFSLVPDNTHMFLKLCGGECGGDMPKRLTAQLLNTNMAAGRYYDDSGTGLHIYVRKSGSKSWSQKIRFGGKQLELGLGNYPMVSLAESRRIAAENKALAQRGINPKLERVKPKTIPSFKEVMEMALPSIQDELKNAARMFQSNKPTPNILKTLANRAELRSSASSRCFAFDCQLCLHSLSGLNCLVFEIHDAV